MPKKLEEQIREFDEKRMAQQLTMLKALGKIVIHKRLFHEVKVNTYYMNTLSTYKPKSIRDCKRVSKKLVQIHDRMFELKDLILQHASSGLLKNTSDLEKMGIHFTIHDDQTAQFTDQDITETAQKVMEE